MMKKKLAPLLALGFLLLVPEVRAASLPATEFDEMYNDVAAFLMDPAHHPDLARGRVAIEYGDAKAYYPAWVYARARLDPGSVPAAELAIAREMHERYAESFSRLEAKPLLAFKDLNLAMDAAIGIEGILRAYEFTGEPEYLELSRRYLDLARPLASHPGLLFSYHLQPYGPMTVIAGGAWFYLEYAQAAGPEDPYSADYQAIGLKILDRLDKRLYRPEQGKYLYSSRPGYDFTYVYNNAVMVQALVRAFALTGDGRWLDRARELLAALERDLYRPAEGGFLAAEDSPRFQRQYEKVGPQYNREYMALSAHNYLVYAYLALYEAGGFRDDELLEKAAVCLRFERDRLWDREGRIHHHLERGVRSELKDYCMGCNFETLFHVAQYQAMLIKQPVLDLAPGPQTEGPAPGP